MLKRQTESTWRQSVTAFLLALLPMVLLPLAAPQVSMAAVPDDRGQAADCPVVRLDVERLPDLNTPRSGHALVWVDSALMAVGGHTSGFVPTATAELLHPGDKAWRQLQTVYIHDFALALPLRSGQLLVTGGAAEALGIGQTFTVERYAPAEDAFCGFGCLDTKRMYAQGVELDSGRVLISGNWYHRDDIELFDGQKNFAAVKPPTQQRSLPYIFRSGKDDALIIGYMDNYGKPLTDASWVDRLAGEAFRAPLLGEWRPLSVVIGHYDAYSFVGDEQAGVYASLMPVVNGTGQVALAKVEGTDISLVPTACPVPMQAEGADIAYFYSVIVDRQARRAYLPGIDSLHRFYFFCTDLVPAEGRLLPATGEGGARLYRTDTLPGLSVSMPTLTPDGDIVMVGGIVQDNYHPLSTAYRFLLGKRPAGAVTPQTAASRPWLWLLLAGGVLAAGGILCILIVRHQRKNRLMATSVPDSDPSDAKQQKVAATADVLQRINHLMEREHIYLNPDLKLSDVAERLGLPRAQVSSAINAQLGCSFPQYLVRYRVEHAQQLLRQHPDKKMATIGEESGFANETSFFRTFKAVTGMTPKEWVQQEP